MLDQQNFLLHSTFFCDIPSLFEAIPFLITGTQTVFTVEVPANSGPFSDQYYWQNWSLSFGRNDGTVNHLIAIDFVETQFESFMETLNYLFVWKNYLITRASALAKNTERAQTENLLRGIIRGETKSKRLRAEIISSQSSSEESQSSYQPNTESSESSDEDIDDLQPTWKIGDFDLSAALISFRKLQTYTRKVNLLDVDLSMFINRSINPLINVVFGYNSHLSKTGNFTKLEGTTLIKPGIKYNTVIKQHKMDILVIEVDDLFRSSVELKILLFLYAFSCHIFKMDLKAPAIYRMIKIRTCFLPRCGIYLLPARDYFS
ncbi:hypothetical protein BD770DRAFT_409720 [Pilaira anomala]|nr:hypothetical protein BD770DRAFT_409720 [Pilaira anomala]